IIKPFEQPSSPVLEEPEPVSCVLQGDEIQALAIKPEDLAKVEEKEKPVVIKKYLIRKSRPQEIGKKANLLVAYPALPDESKKILNYSGTIISIFSCCGSNQCPGSLRMIPEESQLSCAISVFGTYRKKPEEKKKVAQSPPSQHRALQNWQRNMAIRRRQQKRLWNEFWNQPVHVGDEIKGLTTTLGQTDLGFPEEVTHVGKPRSIWREMGEGEVGIAARVTFEILVGDKAESLLTVSNDGTTAIWYDWRRLPPPFTFQEKITRGIQNFYFNTRSGVILPGETINFSFIFKSSSGGIFNESWEFSTHPELLGGAMLQVTLWGIALYEDTTVKLREDLEKDLEAREIAVIVEENLEELLNRIRTPARVRSPVDAYVTEEELFHRKNPELHYNHQVVKGLHELWNRVMNPQPVEVYIEEEQGKSTVSETSPSKSTADSQKSPEEIRKSLSSPTFITKSLGLEELVDEPSRTDTEEGALVEEAPHVEWNLSIADFRQEEALASPTNVARGAFAQVRLVRQLCPFLDRDALRTVTHALVTLRLDYCNALYLGLPLHTIRRLQLVQNAAARVVMGVTQFSHITPLLRGLHWLPVALRVRFKVLTLTFKVLHDMGPQYLRERLLPISSATRPVRAHRQGLLGVPSASQCRLAVPRRRAYSVAVPDLWNELPLDLRLAPDLRTFRRDLKT
uniref:MYCBP associated protein n=1 Tax=Naja naja TaxID=35670 RepID=A0A8C7DX51_NAJNA